MADKTLKQELKEVRKANRPNYEALAVKYGACIALVGLSLVGAFRSLQSAARPDMSETGLFIGAAVVVALLLVLAVRSTK